MDARSMNGGLRATGVGRHPDFHQARSRRHKTRAQAFVELALLLPMMVLMLAFAVDVGRAITAYITISSAAREGAAFGMRAAALAESPTIWGRQPQVAFPTCTDPMTAPNGTAYRCVAVQVSYRFQPLITIWPIPNEIPMQRTV
jgi:hypothetical protein